MEWKGAKPQHWKGSIKIVKQPSCTEKLNDINNTTRRHFSVNCESQEKEYRPHIKTFPIIKTNKDSRPNVRYIDPVYTEPKVYIRRSLAASITIKEEPPRGKKRIFVNSQAKEHSLEKIFGNKKRFLNMEQIRNGMPLLSLGDKIYKNVEHSKDFFKLEGLVVGSTNSIRQNKTGPRHADNFYSSLDLNTKTLDSNKLWKTKVLRESLNFDDNYVRSLDEKDKLLPQSEMKNSSKAIPRNSNVKSQAQAKHK